MRRESVKAQEYGSVGVWKCGSVGVWGAGFGFIFGPPAKRGEAVIPWKGRLEVEGTRVGQDL